MVKAWVQLKKGALDCQQQISLENLWFIPNPSGSDVDSFFSDELEAMEASERPEEILTISMPKVWLF